jgi:hypothetical protein
MNRSLLDTDILSEIIKGRDLVVAAKARAYLTQVGRFTTLAVSVAAIIYGFRRIGREDRVCQRGRPRLAHRPIAFGGAEGRGGKRVPKLIAGWSGRADGCQRLATARSEGAGAEREKVEPLERRWQQL